MSIRALMLSFLHAMNPRLVFRWRILGVVLLLVLGWSSGWAADTVRLTNGTRIKGTILEERDDDIVMQVGSERRTVSRAKIASMSRSAPAYPAMPESDWLCVGPGGGGAMYVPTLSPVDPNLGLIACDMGGVYLTRDAGRNWSMLPTDHIGRYGEGLAFASKNPRVIFVGTSARLYRSTDAGASWAPVTENRKHPLCSVMDVLVDPDDDRLVWVSFGTGGEAGQKISPNNRLIIERSTDGGATFVDASVGLPKEAGLVRQLAVDVNSPISRRTVYAATTRGLFVSGDGGATWKRGGMNIGKDDLRQVVTLSDPKSKTTVVLVSADPSGVYRSDDGVSFTPVEGIPAKAIVEGLAASVVSSTTAWAAGSTIWRTTDGGKHWLAVYDDAVKQAGWMSTFYPWFQRRNRGVGCDPLNPDRAWFTGDMHLWSTMDGGASFTELNSHPYPDRQKRAVYRDASELGRHGLVDKGPTTFTGGGLEVTFMYQVSPDPLRKGRVYSCCADTGGFRSEDAGESWTYNLGTWNQGIRSDWRNSCYEIAFHPKAPGIIWGAFSSRHNLPNDEAAGHGGVAFSPDGGATWTPFEKAGLPEQPVTSICIDQRLKGPTLYAAVHGTGVFVSRNGGKQWEAMSQGLPRDARAWRIRQGADNTLYLICSLGKPGGIWRYDESARAWQRLDRDPAFADVRDLTIVQGDKRDVEILAVAVDGPGGGLFVSKDHGEQWLRMSDEPATSVTCTPDFKTWFACGKGLRRSTDGGSSWTTLDFPFAALNDVTLDPHDPTTVWVGTAGGGVFKGSVNARPAQGKSR